MKKQLLSLGFVVAIALQGFAQSKVILPSSVYEDMKAKGQLKPDVQYTPISDDIHPTRPLNTIAHDPNAHTPVRKNVVHHTNQPTTAGPNCSCIATIDTSFDIVPICQGTCFPPDYRNDDGSTAQLTIPFNFCFYGVNYNHLYINNNGNITFDVPVSVFSAVGFPSANYDMVAPFWADVDTRNTASGLVYYKITPTYMIVQWDSVGYYSEQVDRRCTFQLIITNGSDAILPPGNNIAFCYGSMNWTTGGASCTSNSCTYNSNTYTCTPFCGVPATVGANNGTNGSYFQMGRFDHPGVDYSGAYSNDGVNWLDYQSIYFNSCASTNIPPISSGLNNCDTIKICHIGDTLLLHPLFLSPESGQTTTLSINLNGTPGASIISNDSGNTANALIQIIATSANAGVNTITITATDNGVPVGITTVNAIIYVDTTALANFHPIITGNLSFCQGGSTTLSVSPTTYDAYVWNTSALTTSINVTAPGTYWVTSTLGGCHKTNEVHVTEHLNPTPVIVGPLNTCVNGSVTLHSDSLFSTYLWSPTGGSQDSATVGDGTYTLTVTNQYGCTGVSPSVTVSGPPLPVVTTGTLPCNTAPAVLTTTTPGLYTSFLWSNGSTHDTAHVHVSPPLITVTVHDTNGCVITSAPYTVAAFMYALSVTGVHPYCEGQTLVLTASTNNLNGSPTYTWTPSGTHDTIHITSGGTYTVTLHYANGCTADSVVTVPPPNPIPTPVITGLLFTCGTLSTTLTVTAAGSPNPHYIWNGVSPTDSTTTASVTAGTYSVTVTDGNGCVGTSPPVTVTNISPSVTVTGDTLFCPGSSITLTANAIPTTGVSYLWSNNQTTPTITVSAAGTYHVTVNYGNGCTATSNPNTIVILFHNPVANFTVNPPLTNSPVTNTQFTSTSSVSLPATITGYYWNFGDGATSTSNLQNPTHSYGANGTYSVLLVVTSSDGCTDSIREDYLIQDIIQVPNVITPNEPGAAGKNNMLYFKNLEYYTSPTIVIYDRWGIKVYESNNYQNDWNGGKEVDGVYYFILNAPLFQQPIKGFFEIIR